MNTGMETPTRAPPMNSRSMRLLSRRKRCWFLQMAEMMPAMIPTTQAKRAAKMDSRTVLGKALMMSAETGRLSL